MAGIRCDVTRRARRRDRRSVIRRLTHDDARPIAGDGTGVSICAEMMSAFGGKADILVSKADASFFAHVLIVSLAKRAGRGPP